MNGKKAALIGLLSAVLAVSGFAAYSNFIKAKPVGVSKLKNNPETYLGNVLITGKTGRISTEEGLIEMVDEKACCTVVLAVPTTAAQKAQSGADAVYSGRLPAQGQNIEVDAKLKKTSDGYSLDVKEVRASSGEVLLKKG